MNTQTIVEFDTEIYLWCSNCEISTAKSKVPLINKCRKCPNCNHYKTLKQIGSKRTEKIKDTIRHAAIKREHRRILQEITIRSK